MLLLLLTQKLGWDSIQGVRTQFLLLRRLQISCDPWCWIRQFKIKVWCSGNYLLTYQRPSESLPAYQSWFAHQCWSQQSHGRWSCWFACGLKHLSLQKIRRLEAWEVLSEFGLGTSLAPEDLSFLHLSLRKRPNLQNSPLMPLVSARSTRYGLKWVFKSHKVWKLGWAADYLNVKKLVWEHVKNIIKLKYQWMY